MSADDYVAELVANRSPNLPFLRSIRKEKARGTRPWPSSRLIGTGTEPPFELRARLLDKVAELVDENVYGRSDMCLQFAALLTRALARIGISAAAKTGKASYRKQSDQLFTWDHAWVEYDGYVIDGNVDSMCENPKVDEGVDPSPFWGRREDIPDDRRFDFESSTPWVDDEDVDAWWPRLSDWLDAEVVNATDSEP
jgi:hypothetical protein